MVTEDNIELLSYLGCRENDGRSAIYDADPVFVTHVNGKVMKYVRSSKIVHQVYFDR